MIKSIFAALLPARCVLCGDTIVASVDEACLCAGCAASLPLPPDPALSCPCCAAPVWRADDNRPHRCQSCLHQAPAFDLALAAFPYAFPLDVLIRQLKYHHQLGLARWLGQQLAASIAGHWPDFAFDGIVPLPLHPARLRQRGFNQAALLARHVARHQGWPLWLSACQRVVPTLPQASLDRAGRLENVSDAFFCPEPLDGARILLLDDVMTTGSTLNACAASLKAAGAAAVAVAVVARAQGDGSA